MVEVILTTTLSSQVVLSLRGIFALEKSVNFTSARLMLPYELESVFTKIKAVHDPSVLVDSFGTSRLYHSEAKSDSQPS